MQVRPLVTEIGLLGGRPFVACTRFPVARSATARALGGEVALLERLLHIGDVRALVAGSFVPRSLGSWAFITRPLVGKPNVAWTLIARTFVTRPLVSGLTATEVLSLIGN
ncbi:MAG: hypothetical protein ACTSYK_07120, partial [Alphaproteobacteria bacterium]